MTDIEAEAIELIRRRAEGIASEAETRKLELLMRENPQIVDLHVEYLMLDQALASCARERVGAVEQENEQVRTARPLSVSRALLVGLSLAAAVLVMVGLRLGSPTPANSIRVRIVAVDRVELQNHLGPFDVGGAIDLGRIGLISGRLEVELESGVRLEMIAPFDGMLLDAMQLRLIRGRLNADVGARGRGFTVRSDAGDVVDLGTRFGVEADAGGECRVAVFSGEVQLRPRRAEGAHNEPPVVTLIEGQAARFSARAGLRQWREVALAAKAAGISTQPYTGVVATIHDNLGTEKLHPFYGLVQAGMREGAIAYTDKPRPAWLAAEGEEFPQFLEGADLIRTYHQFRGRLNYRLRLEMREAAEIFILRDVREEAPEWLKTQFKDTGTRLRVGPWNPAVAAEPGVLLQRDEPYIVVAVWRRTVDAGVVELGSARATDDDTLTIMYGLAVKALAK